MLWWLAQNAVAAAALAGVVALMCRRFRFRPAVRHALWLVVLLKLLTPSLVQWPWSPADLWPTALAGAEAVRPPGERILLLGDEFIEGAEAAAEDAGPAVALMPGPERLGMPAVVASSGDPAGPVPGAWLGSVILAVWLGGAAVVGFVQALRIARFARRLRQARPAPRRLTDLVEEQAARLRVRPPRTLVLPGIASPQVWGLGPPLLLWPAALLDTMTADRRRAVLVHELAHLRRRDHWVGWLVLLAGCLWWWNPVFWYVRRQLAESAELACDAWVVWLLPGARRAYAEALIEVTESVSRSATPLPALGVSGGRQDFERRLTMIMRERVPCQVPFAGLVAIGLLTLIALPGWSLGQKVEKVEKIIKEVPAKDDTKGVAEVEVVIQKYPTGGKDAGPGGDRDRQLQQLEMKLQALLKEIQDMKKASDTKAAPQPKKDVIKTIDVEVRPKTSAAPNKLAESALTKEKLIDLWSKKKTGSEEEVRLSRGTYRLPGDKAAALAAFLKEHVKADVVEIKLEGETLTVTTTPQAQQAIGQFIALVMDKPGTTKEKSRTTGPAK